MSPDVQFSKALTFKIHKAVFLLDKISDSLLLEKFSLTYSQFLNLVAIGTHRDVSQKEISEFLEMTEAAVSRQIDLLVKKRLILRKENPNNRREYILELSPAGQKILKKASESLDEKSAEIFSVLSKDQKSKLTESLDKLLHQLCPNQKNTLCDRLETNNK